MPSPMPTTPPRPRVNPRPAGSGRYSRQTLHITVGRSKEPFHVHYSHLERTAFFEIHGTPAAARSRAPSVSGDRNPTVSPDPVKQEEDVDAPGSDADSNANMLVEESPSTPVYHLDGRCHDPASFEVIVNWLYNISPKKPVTRNQCRTLLKAYVLALTYKITLLQDALIDCFRQYHQDYNIVFEDLIWLVNRLEETREVLTVPMVRYLVDQIAWEISQQGYATFTSHNIFFETFLIEGNRPIRKTIFEAVADLLRPTRPGDPAIGPSRYRVQDWEAPQQTLQRQIIELDD
ncbi:uncharacterized protein Z518_07129 [Rhinocladiella mackenziei CBS 650.93]|uniref:BTB domain-containing protein n=1 Tax=Rhinocladiella mackenziei CBS 650.93 TaxID=1442369 RepID=A0A0D2IK29_9EURO|nr:uncharacterized protein Z518_07129 [Rhinocladiella mackenziei CBS 650.93]KIX03576.1 hypothetical protein Z518_07129 [Rhinocladiella mackenziei CBS 650.93]